MTSKVRTTPRPADPLGPVDRIIAEAEVTRATLCRHFPSMGMVPVDDLFAALSASAWKCLSAGTGAHGPRIYQRALTPIRVSWQPGCGGYWVVARRHPTPASCPTAEHLGDHLPGPADHHRVADEHALAQGLFRVVQGGLPDGDVDDERTKSTRRLSRNRDVRAGPAGPPINSDRPEPEVYSMSENRPVIS
ncbi:hypothetical protein ACPPVO_23690 [Dactylosporangium sp. McL0621]|uniref:hypothetical protein n=1 Tax=Dactylosporangium sp. McL0621 TaxID=3415678 RepID=UPI003CF2A947